MLAYRINVKVLLWILGLQKHELKGKWANCLRILGNHVLYNDIIYSRTQQHHWGSSAGHLACTDSTFIHRVVSLNLFKCFYPHDLLLVIPAVPAVSLLCMTSVVTRPLSLPDSLGMKAFFALAWVV